MPDPTTEPRADEPVLLRHRAEWLLAQLVLWPMDVLPSAWLHGGARAAARVTCLVSAERRRNVARRVEERLGLAAGCPREKLIIQGAFETLLLNVVEPVLLERALARGRRLDELVAVEGEEHLRGALASGRGVIVATGHIGAWESLLIVLHRMFRPSWIVARRLKNPLLDRQIVARRLHWAMGRLPMDGSGPQMARLLRSGECIGLLLDQNAGRQGVLLDFLGAPSSHHHVAGIMAARTGALAVPAYLLREAGPVRLRLVIEAPVEAPRGGSPTAAALEVTRRLSRSLEAQVRAHPEQWLWLHDRWERAERLLREEGPAREGRYRRGRPLRTG